MTDHDADRFGRWIIKNPGRSYEDYVKSQLDEPLPGWEFGKALADAGVIGEDVARLVIDVPANGVVKLYVERIGSRKLLRVVTTLEGAKIETVDAEKMPA